MIQPRNRLLQLYFIRHGKPIGRSPASTPAALTIPLTARGEEMARQLAPSLRRVAFASVFTSPSLRARQTCERAGLAPASEITRICRNGTTATTKDSYPRTFASADRTGTCGGTDAQGENLRSKSLIAPTGCSRDCSGSKGNIALFSHGQFAACWLRDGSDCRPLRDGTFAIYPVALRHIRTRKRLSGKTGHIALERRDYIFGAGGRGDRPASRRMFGLVAGACSAQSGGRNRQAICGGAVGAGMAAFRIVKYSPDHFEGLKALWQEAFPNDPQWSAREIAATALLPEWSDLFFVAEDASKVVGSILVGFDGHQGWLICGGCFEFSPTTGHRVRSRSGSRGAACFYGMRPNAAFQVGLSNADVVGFYGSLGYAVEECISMEKHLVAIS